MTGRFIVFEGIDGEVLASQAQLLVEWLRSKKLSVVLTRQPTDGPIGAQIGLALEEPLRVNELTRAAMFLADRMDHIYREGDGILRSMEAGYHVVCVRYLLSAYARQSEVVTFEWLKRINKPCPWPDLMLFLDTPVEKRVARFQRQEGFDREGVETRKAELEKRRLMYLQGVEQCRNDGFQVAVIDGNQPADVVELACRSLVRRLISAHNP